MILLFNNLVFRLFCFQLLELGYGYVVYTRKTDAYY